MNTSDNLASKWNRLLITIGKGWRFVSEDIWKCKSNNVFIHIIKTLNLSIRCFLNEQLQQRSSALTFRTLLAIVPALALLLAIGKGFGFSSIFESQIFEIFPTQRDALEYTFSLVEAYMAQMKAGVFVGIGIIALLWTLITLMSEIEKTFNDLWNVPNRKLARRITDYMAMFIIIPILLVSSNGMSIFASTVLDKIPYISQLGQHIMQLSSYVLSWLLFTAVYIFLPNTQVKFKHAFISGIICGTAFNLFQWIYLSGQIWVSKYNAIYGSFAFLPLLMLWMQLSWLICLFGVVLSYSSQNVYNFEYEKEISTISRNYYKRILMIIMSVILRHRKDNKPPLTCYELSQMYQIPIQLVNRAVDDLIAVNLLAPTPTEDDFAYIATTDNSLTTEEVMHRIDNYGCKNFVDSLVIDENDSKTSITDTLVIDFPIPQISKNIS